MFPGIYFKGGEGGCGTIGITMYLFFLRGWGDFSWDNLLLGGDSW